MGAGIHHGWIYSKNYPRIESFKRLLPDIPTDIDTPWLCLSNGIWFSYDDLWSRPRPHETTPPKEYVVQHLLLGE